MGGPRSLLALRGLAALALACPLAAGCSLLGLDDFGYTECADDAPCAALNARDAIADDACVGWECDGRHCRLRPRDSDRDGDLRAVCEGGEDCDDHDEDRNGGRLEVCDGHDQDCDLRIDEAHDDPSVPLPLPQPVLRLLETATVLGIDADPAGGVAVTYLDTRRGVGLDHIRDLTEITAAGAPLIPDAGCVRTHATPIAPEDACVASDCGAPLTCAPRADGLAVCGAFGASCATDAECGNGLACDGLERCAPADPEADGRGCAPTLDTPCDASDARCDEAHRACVTEDPPQNPCELVDLASAPVGDGVRVGVAVARVCDAGSVRVVHFETADPDRALLAIGGPARSTSYGGLDPDVNGCTGATRVADATGIAGARSVSVAALPADGFRTPQALAAYLGGPREGTDPARVEVFGIWLETQAGDVRWTSASGGGVPLALEASRARPAIVARDGDPGEYVLAFPRADGEGIAVHVFAQHPEPAPGCSGTTLPPCLDAGAAGPRTRLDPESTAPRESPALVHEVATSLAEPGVEGEVSIAASTARPEIALAWRAPGRVVLSIVERDALGGTAPPVAAVHAVPVAEARWVSVAYVDAGLSLADPPGGFVLVWSGASGTFAARRLDAEPELTAPVRVGPELERPRATRLADGLALVGRAAEGVVAIRFACGAPAP